MKVTTEVPKVKRNKLDHHELEELREHIDQISYKIGKAYRQVRDRHKKEFKQARNTQGKKLHNSYKSEKWT